MFCNFFLSTVVLTKIIIAPGQLTKNERRTASAGWKDQLPTNPGELEEEMLKKAKEEMLEELLMKMRKNPPIKGHHLEDIEEVADRAATEGLKRAAKEALAEDVERLEEKRREKFNKEMQMAHQMSEEARHSMEMISMPAKIVVHTQNRTEERGAPQQQARQEVMLEARDRESKDAAVKMVDALIDKEKMAKTSATPEMMINHGKANDKMSSGAAKRGKDEAAEKQEEEEDKRIQRLEDEEFKKVEKEALKEAMEEEEEKEGKKTHSQTLTVNKTSSLDGEAMAKPKTRMDTLQIKLQDDKEKVVPPKQQQPGMLVMMVAKDVSRKDAMQNGIRAGKMDNDSSEEKEQHGGRMATTDVYSTVGKDDVYSTVHGRMGGKVERGAATEVYSTIRPGAMATERVANNDNRGGITRDLPNKKMNGGDSEMDSLEEKKLRLRALIRLAEARLKQQHRQKQQQKKGGVAMDKVKGEADEIYEGERRGLEATLDRTEKLTVKE